MRCDNIELLIGMFDCKLSVVLLPLFIPPTLGAHPKFAYLLYGMTEPKLMAVMQCSMEVPMWGFYTWQCRVMRKAQIPEIKGVKKHLHLATCNIPDPWTKECLELGKTSKPIQIQYPVDRDTTYRRRSCMISIHWYLSRDTTDEDQCLLTNTTVCKYTNKMNVPYPRWRSISPPHLARSPLGSPLPSSKDLLVPSSFCLIK